MIDRASVAAEHGLIMNRHPVPGRILRCATVEAPRGLDGAFFIDVTGNGWVQNWKRHAAPVPFGSVGAVEPAEARRRARDAMQRADRIAAAAALRAAADWAAAGQVDPAHPYIARKGIVPYGARQTGDRIVLPFGVAGRIMTLQTIAPDGAKRFMKDGRKRGSYCALGGEDGPIATCEGWATGCDIREATGWRVAVAGDAGNLVPVSRYLRNRYPRAVIIICGDNDVSGRGQQAAVDAARAVGARVALPLRKGSDFNDVAAAEGLDAVRDLIMGGAHG